MCINKAEFEPLYKEKLNPYFEKNDEQIKDFKTNRNPSKKKYKILSVVLFICSDSQTESRKKLSPSRMQKLSDFHENKDRNISLSFIINKMHILMESSSDHFEPSFDSNKNADIDFVYEDLSIITDISSIV